MMRLPKDVARADGAASLGAGSLQPRRKVASRAPRLARIFTGTLCGLGVTLFPGLALLALQAGLVIAWALLMISLFAGSLADAGRLR